MLAVFYARIQLWGSPSDASHDGVRGGCISVTNTATCPVTRTGKPLLSLPTSCTDSMQIDAQIDLWEDIGHFHDRSAPLERLQRQPDRGHRLQRAAQFAPTLKARPTTDVADSPTGLDFDLGVPQTDNVSIPPPRT